MSVVPSFPRSFSAAQLLRSPRIALVVLMLTLVYTGVASWFPWLTSPTTAAPAWALRLGLDHPFRSPPFLLACALLFVNTLACTWGRWGRVRRIWRGSVPGRALRLPVQSSQGARSFLLNAGFKAGGEVFFKSRFALWGGFVLHVGILTVILSVAIQQAYFDGGSFEVSEREMVSLDGAGVVFGREAGVLAPAHPPALKVALDSFNANLHQKGYAPDLQSALTVLDTSAGGRQVKGTIDRARGLSVGDTTIYQAIPTGFSVNAEIQGMGVRSIHLREQAPKRAWAEVSDPAGEPVRFVLESERPLADTRGEDRISLRLERRGQSQELLRGAAFRFGKGEARVVGIARWGGYTYARTPGVGLVFAGFGIALLGCFLLLFPSGMARLEQEGAELRLNVYLSRGGDLLLAEYHEEQGPASTETT